MKKIFFLSIVSVMAITVLGAGCSLPGMSKKESNTDKIGGVYKSIDAGVTWAQKTAFPTAQGVGNIGTASIQALITDPQDHNTIYVGTSENGLLISYNGGETWQAANDEKLQSGSVVSLAVDYKEMCSLYAAIGQKVYVSKNCGRTFEEAYNETRSKVKLNRLVADWYNSGVIYLGLNNGDLLKSSDFGNSWSRVYSFNKSISSILISNQDSRVILIGTEEGYWKTADAGLNWMDKTDALKDFSQAKFIFDLKQNSGGSTIVMSNRYGLLRSTDLGETWEAITLLTPAKQVEITALAIDPKDVNTIYYASASTFYKTVNGGINWTTQELTDGWIAANLVIDPTDTYNLYLGYQLTEN